MKQDVILVLDCGATNVRAMAVDRQGNIIARAATANASDIAAEKSDWHQWSLEAIMQRFADCCRQIHEQLASCTVRGITVTTFGVDGALVDEQGALLYPIISWKCPRTAAVMDTISRYMPARQLQQIAGVGAFAFNTLYKLIWLKENHPQLLAQAHAWLFISSLINHRLTGVFSLFDERAVAQQQAQVETGYGVGLAGAGGGFDQSFTMEGKTQGIERVSHDYIISMVISSGVRCSRASACNCPSTSSSSSGKQRAT